MHTDVASVYANLRETRKITVRIYIVHVHVIYLYGSFVRTGQTLVQERLHIPKNATYLLVLRDYIAQSIMGRIINKTRST